VANLNSSSCCAHYRLPNHTSAWSHGAAYHLLLATQTSHGGVDSSAAPQPQQHCSRNLGDMRMLHRRTPDAMKHLHKGEARLCVPGHLLTATSIQEALEAQATAGMEQQPCPAWARLCHLQSSTDASPGAGATRPSSSSSPAPLLLTLLLLVTSSYWQP
jgi:hypothetical protein